MSMTPTGDEYPELREPWQRRGLWPMRSIAGITVGAADYVLDTNPDVDLDDALQAAELAEVRQLFAVERQGALDGWEALTATERGRAAQAALAFLQGALTWTEAAPAPGDRVRLRYQDGSGSEGTWELGAGEFGPVEVLRRDDGTVHTHTAGQVERQVLRRADARPASTARALREALSSIEPPR